ncbi:MAG TPA: hypothetical protein VFT23_01970 [Burkholderiales bacterium]|nr:hypothetical protein [Burkholderiales bacterium]
MIAPMMVGDLVWIYESESGRPIVGVKADGERVQLLHHSGRGGVVTLVEVTAAAEEDPDSEIERYADGSSIWWRWRARTRTVNSAGFVPRTELNLLLGYKPTNPLRGFGTRNSGLMEITAGTHRRILDAFLASYQARDAARLKQAASTTHRGAGGEGAVHKALKEAIAADPSRLLGEGHLELVQMEYPFGATGDRIDVLLRDGLGRYVAVEVEPVCPVGHIAGPLQCMKYRALLAYHLDREVNEIRTCLITHDLESGVREKAEKYGIECKQIPSLAPTQA